MAERHEPGAQPGIRRGLVIAAGICFGAAAGAAITATRSAEWGIGLLLLAFLLLLLSFGFFAFGLLEETGDYRKQLSQVRRDMEARRSLGVGQVGVHRSIQHLLDDPNVLHPKTGRSVDIIIDGADLPAGFVRYARSLRQADVELRLMMLDPDSELVHSHQLALDHETGAEFVRSRLCRAIDELSACATIKLFDTLPPGIMFLIDDHVILGTQASVPTDVSLPLLELEVDIREHVYWTFRRTFDRMWERAKPAGRASSSTRAPSLVESSV